MPTPNPTPAPRRAAPPGPYDLFILALSLAALFLLGASALMGLDPDTRTILEYADLLVCVVFFGDFLHQLRVAPSRSRYLLTWGWLDLLSSIPFLHAFRMGRAARVFRIIRVLRGLRGTRVVVSHLVARRAQGAFLAATLVALVVLFFSSAAILQFETAPESSIHTPGDALWWALATITTVGYGDVYPVTDEGRVIGGLLMVVGVGLFATLSGLIASWFLAPQEEEEEDEIRKLRKEIAALRASLEGRRE